MVTPKDVSKGWFFLGVVAIGGAAVNGTLATDPLLMVLGAVVMLGPYIGVELLEGYRAGGEGAADAS